MKNNFVLSLAALILVAAAVPAFAEPVASIENPTGEVMLQPAGSAPEIWQAVSQNTPVNNGDSIKTMNGNFVLVYTDQARIDVQPNTSITVKEQPGTQDILLSLGHLRARVNKAKVTKPFQVVSPTAVAAVRGTDVDFDLNKDSDLTVDLHDEGPVQVFNDDAEMALDLANAKKIKIKFDKKTGELTVSNDCTSSGPVSFNVGANSYTIGACESSTVKVEMPTTAAGGNTPPGTNSGSDSGEDTPNEDPPPPDSGA